MNAIFVVLTVLIVVAAILLCIVVLLQNGKGEGMASNFISANQTLGVRQTADILEKTSWILVTFILVVSVCTSILSTRRSATDIDITDNYDSLVVRAVPLSTCQRRKSGNRASRHHKLIGNQRCRPD